jgi:hypothetical protein
MAGVSIPNGLQEIKSKDLEIGKNYYVKEITAQGEKTFFGEYYDNLDLRGNLTVYFRNANGKHKVFRTKIDGVEKENILFFKPPEYMGAPHGGKRRKSSTRKLKKQRKQSKKIRRS